MNSSTTNSYFPIKKREFKFLLLKFHRNTLTLLDSIDEKVIKHISSENNFVNVESNVWNVDTRFVEPSLKDADVTCGNPVNVRLSFIYSSRNFFVRLNNNFETLSNDLNCFYSTYPDKKPLNVDSIFKRTFCCIFNKNDMKYYRALLINPSINNDSNQNYRCLLVDYGNTVYVEREKIFPLVKQFREEPICTINCFLTDFWNKDNVFLEHYLKGFASIESPNVEMQATFFQPVYDKKYPVTLKVRNSILSNQWMDLISYVATNMQMIPRTFDIMAKFKFVDFINFPNPNYQYADCCIYAIHKFFKVPHFKFSPVLSRIYKAQILYEQSSTEKLIVHLIRNGNHYNRFCDSDTLTTNQTYFYHNSIIKPLAGIPSDSLVIFKYKIESDSAFYFRGFVLDINEMDDEVELLSIDYGFISTIQFCDIYPLYQAFDEKAFPPFAYVCSRRIEANHHFTESLPIAQTIDLKPCAVCFKTGDVMVQISPIDNNSLQEHF